MSQRQRERQWHTLHSHRVHDGNWERMRTLAYKGLKEDSTDSCIGHFPCNCLSFLSFRAQTLLKFFCLALLFCFYSVCAFIFSFTYISSFRALTIISLCLLSCAFLKQMETECSELIPNPRTTNLPLLGP